MLNKYDAIAGEELKYLRYMYKFKEKWAQAFHERHFSAQLQATSRGESFNSLCKRFLSKATSLEHVRSLLAEDTEIKNQFATDELNGADVRKNTKVVDTLECYQSMASIVTRAVYHGEVNEQMTLSKAKRYNLTNIRDPESDVLRELQVQVVNGLVRTLTVRDDGGIVTIMSCSCLYSVSMGLPCRHMFHAVSRLDQPSYNWTIDSACILPRWHRDIQKERETYEVRLPYLLEASAVSSGEADGTSSSSTSTQVSETVHRARFGSLYNKFKPYFDYMSRNAESYEKACRAADELLQAECPPDMSSAREVGSSESSSLTPVLPLLNHSSSVPDLAGNGSLVPARAAKDPLKPTKRGRKPKPKNYN